MARGTQLSQLRDMLRAEIGASPNVGMGVNAQTQYDHILNRTQQWLWNDFEWPFATIERDEQTVAGQRYYAFDNDIDFDRILSAHVKHGDTWTPLSYRIGPDELNAQDSDAGEQAEPILRWDHHEGSLFEVWPVPSSSEQVIRFKAVQRLPYMQNGSDVALLDDNLIVMFSAAELLARSGAKDAELKLSAARSHYNKVRGNMTKRDRFIFGGGIAPGERIRYVGGRAVKED